MPDKPSLLIISRHAPYGSSRSRASLDLVLAAAAFEQNVSLLLMGKGVLQLLDRQAPPDGVRHHQKMMSSLPLYDVETVHVEQAALEAHGLAQADLYLPTTTLNETELPLFCSRFDRVINL